MKQSQLFTKTRKEVPADEVAKNAQLLIQAGYIHKEMAGVYSFLPLGLRVVRKISHIVREEMNAIGGEELTMTSLQRKEIWESTGRWDDEKVDVWFKTRLKNDTEVGLGWSHEEAIIDMAKPHLTSYKDLPFAVYQFQTKLRNELRAKSGIMRGREFLMKDMYSCSINQAQHDDFYQKTIEAYHRVFARIGIGEMTFLTYASGGAFTEFSHEFQTVCTAGEDIIYLDREKKVAINDEIYSEELVTKLGLNTDSLEKVSAAEVGNIFDFGTVKSEQTNFKFKNSEGTDQFVHLGSYGIGITRLMGVVTELLADDKGLVWPEAVAPFTVHLLSLNQDEKTEELYTELERAGVEVLYDDRDTSPGKKLGDADLLGVPTRVVMSEKSLAAGGVEVTSRGTGKSEIIPLEALVARFA